MGQMHGRWPDLHLPAGPVASPVENSRVVELRAHASPSPPRRPAVVSPSMEDIPINDPVLMAMLRSPVTAAAAPADDTDQGASMGFGTAVQVKTYSR